MRKLGKVLYKYAAGDLVLYIKISYSDLNNLGRRKKGGNPFNLASMLRNLSLLDLRILHRKKCYGKIFNHFLRYFDAKEGFFKVKKPC